MTKVVTTLNDEVLEVEAAELRDLRHLGLLREVDGQPVGAEEEPTGETTEEGDTVTPGTADEPQTEGTEEAAPRDQLGDAPGTPTIVGTPQRGRRQGKE